MKNLHLTMMMVLVSLSPLKAGTPTILTNQKTDSSRIKSNDRIDFSDTNLSKYINQKLYLKKLPAEEQAEGYAGFLIDYRKGQTASNTYAGYKTNRSEYSSLAGHYFMVKDVINFKDKSNIHYLKLKDLKNRHVVYYRFDEKGEEGFPFISINYQKEQQKIYVGKKYVLRGQNWLDYSDDVLDINSGKPVDYSAGTLWTCTNVSIVGPNEELSLILENKLGNKIYYPIDIMPNSHFILSQEDAEQYKQKYGSAWSNILAEKIDLGFTEDMVTLALGVPKTITKTVTTQQWMYDDQFVLFVDGKVHEFR